MRDDAKRRLCVPLDFRSAPRSQSRRRKKADAVYIPDAALKFIFYVFLAQESALLTRPFEGASIFEAPQNRLIRVDDLYPQ